MVNPLLQPPGVHLAVMASSKVEAITFCGQYLLKLGAIEPEYIEAMLEREAIFSSYMGEKFAIPHGTDESRKYVNFGQLVFLRFIDEFLWDHQPVKICIGIAAKGDEQVEILGNLAESILNEDTNNILMTSNDVHEILEVLNNRKGLQ